MNAYILIGLFFLSSSFAIASASNQYYLESSYLLINDDLYEKEDELYIKSQIFSGKNKKQLRDIYIKRFAYEGALEGADLPKKLSEVIDKESWRKLHDNYYRDKSNLYCFFKNSSGGFLSLLPDVNPQEMKFLGLNNQWVQTLPLMRGSKFVSEKGKIDKQSYPLSFYASDGKRVFYLCQEVQGLKKLKSIEVLNKFTIMDDNNLYINGQIFRKFDKQ